MSDKIKMLTDSIQKVIVGKQNVITLILCALLSEGHVLIEDVPGVGKTQLAAALSKSVNGKFNRIQLTPDIMPSDILGFSIVNRDTHEFEYREGIAMCNFLLADEINRASPKVQSSLLEIMEEYQISMDGVTRKLPEPFMVLATQNPVETYGTYHLPEAQMDRFFMKVNMGYPDKSDELQIINRTSDYNPINNISQPVLQLEDIINMKNDVKNVFVSDEVKNYIISIVSSTRNNQFVSLGISPRGSISLFKAIKAFAFINEKDFATPHDVKLMAPSVLSHRLILSPKGKAKFENSLNFIKNTLDNIPVPMLSA